MKEDSREAAGWYARGSAQGDGLATAKLIVLNEEVRGLAKDSPEIKKLREKVRQQLGDNADKALTWAAVRMVEGTWRLPIQAGSVRYLLTLTLSADGTGQFYLFHPTKDDETEGQREVRGLTYKVERRREGPALVLEV